jgi:recombination protein RecA
MAFRTQEKEKSDKTERFERAAPGAEKSKALELAVSSIEKQFGKGSIMRLGTHQSLYKDISTISTGALSLDIALGIGGLPKGRIVEIYGPESSGKTTLALSTIAQSQKTGGVVAFVDAEHALDIAYARKLGVNTEELLISQPDTGEQALEIVETLVRSGAIDVLVVDSVAALTPRAEIEGDMGDSHVGLQARLMSQALRKLTAAISRSSTLVIFINQIRMKIGVMFGNPETTTGGNALKFYSSVRLDVRRIGAIKNGEDVVGNRTAVKVVKNKMAPPFGKVEFDLMYGEGISFEGDLVDLATKYELIDKSGAWYSYNGERMGQGRDQAKTFLKENKAIAEVLRTKILELNKIGVITPETLMDGGGSTDGVTKDANQEGVDAKATDAGNEKANGAEDRKAATIKEAAGATKAGAAKAAATAAKKPARPEH